MKWIDWLRQEWREKKGDKDEREGEREREREREVSYSPVFSLSFFLFSIEIQ
jgi:hypothetical protein